jgi:hypothetical protein
VFWKFGFFTEFSRKFFAVALNNICGLILGDIPNRVGGGGSLAPGGGQASTGGQTERGGLQVLSTFLTTSLKRV